MNRLINLILTELQRVFIEKMIELFFEDMSTRDLKWFILGMICTLLIMEIID